MIRRAALFAGVALFWVAPLVAQEFVDTDGPLSDQDFFRLVTCAAPPGEACASEAARWAKDRQQRLQVALLPAPEGYPPDAARRMSAALDAAIDEINDAGASVRLRRVATADAADIVVHLAPIRAGEKIEGTGVDGLDDSEIGAAIVQVRWDQYYNITEAALVMAADIPAAETVPVMLEELTQSLGFLTDIRNPYYDTVSVFSEDSNNVSKLGPQDRMALRRLYPPD